MAAQPRVAWFSLATPRWRGWHQPARSSDAMVAWLAARGHLCGAGPAETVAAETSGHHELLWQWWTGSRHGGVVDGTPRRRVRPRMVAVGGVGRIDGDMRHRDCGWCGARRCELATTHGGTSALPAPGDFLCCRVVDVQIGWDSPGESLTGFLPVVMTMASEGVVLPIRGVILEPIP